jgi:hypothetical protein
MLMLGSATLIGEVAFTLLQMHGLGLLQERGPLGSARDRIPDLSR